MQEHIIMVVEKTNTGFSAYSSDYPIFTTGRSVPELIGHSHEAVSLYFEDDKAKTHSIKFEIDFQQFFDYYKVINTQYLAEKIGIDNALLSQYVEGYKKPTAKQTEENSCRNTSDRTRIVIN